MARQPKLDAVQKVAQDWTTRAQVLAQQGQLTPEMFQKHIAPLVKQDVRKVKQGGQAMSSGEALNAAMYSLYGKTAVHEKKPSTGLNPKQLFDSAVRDVQDITINAVPGLAKFAGETVLPKNFLKGPGEWEAPPVLARTANLYIHANDPKWLKHHGYDPKIAEISLAGAAAGLRAAGTPEMEPGGKGKKAEAQKPTLWNLIPGVMTAANLTSEEGRKNLTAHPVFTGLDVLPVAAGGAKLLGAAAKASGYAGELGRLAEAGDAGTRVGSVVEAASQGKPLKAAYRAAVPAETRANIAKTATDLMEKKLGTSKPLSAITRTFSITERMNARRLQKWLDKHPIFDEMSKMPIEEQHLITDEAIHPDRYIETLDDGTTQSTISPEHAATIQKLDDATQEILAHRAGTRNLRIRGQNVWYASDNKVTVLFDRLNNLGKSRASAQVAYNDAVRAAMDRHFSKWTKELEAARARRAKLDATPEEFELARQVEALNGLYSTHMKNGDTKLAERVHKRLNTLERRLQRKTRPRMEAERRVGIAEDHLDNAYREVNTENASIVAKRERRDRLFKLQEQTQKSFDDAVERTPPAEYMPMVDDKVLQEVLPRIREKDPSLADDIGESVVQLNDTKDSWLKYFSEDEYAAIQRAAAETWTKLADEGFRPVWVHQYDKASLAEALRRAPLPNQVNNITRLRHSLEDQAPAMTNMAIALPASAFENIMHDGSKYFIRNAIDPHKMSHDEVMEWARKRLERERNHKRKPRFVDEPDLVAMQHLISEHFKTWTPENPFKFYEPKLTDRNLMAGKQFYVPKNYADTIQKLIHPYAKSPIGKGLETSTRIFKSSVLTFSMKHLADEIFGNFMYMMLRGHADMLSPKVFKQAWRAITENKLPVELSTQIEWADSVMSYKSGSWVGKAFQKAGGKMWQIKETANNLYRAMDYYGEKSFLKRKYGLTEVEAHGRALQHTYKALMDLDSMTPLQRSAMRQAFPFYSFIRYALKYVLTYPTDYPVRASILSKIAKIEKEDQSSGLPQIFNQMFNLGGGNTFVDTKVLNPFRDVGNYFTLTGFLGSFSPAIQIPAQMAGLDTFAGAAELYPQITINRQTGSIQAKRPTGSIGKAVEQIVPEAKIFDYVLGLSDETRNMKERDPEAFANRYWDMAMLPFAPKHYDKAEIRGKVAKNWFLIAQQAVSNASQYPSRADNYLKPYEGSNVPYEGRIVPTEIVKSLIQTADKLAPEGYAAKALLPGIKAQKGELAPLGTGAGFTVPQLMQTLINSGAIKPPAGVGSGANQ